MGDSMSPRKRINPDRSRTRVGRIGGRTESFPVDVSDRGSELTVSAELPGLRKQDLDVSVRKDKLRIVADFGDDEGGATYLKRERGRGEVSRVVQLPEPVDEKHVSASYDNGLLWVTLKKRHNPTHVEVG